MTRLRDHKANNDLCLTLGVAVLAMTLCPGRTAAQGITTRVSVDSGGAQANDFSSGPAISRDGRFVAFHSLASNLVPGDTNGVLDVFVHDRLGGGTIRVSVDSTGAEGNGPSGNPSISADGRLVAFQSLASNLALEGADTNGLWDIFVHDLQTGKTTRVSVSSTGAQGNGHSFRPSIDARGRFVAFESRASNLVPADTNATWDVFVHDRQTGTTTRVSVDSAGGQANWASVDASISTDARSVAFYSFASNLVNKDTNGVPDVFVHDRVTGATTRVSVDSSGGEANNRSFSPAIGDGRFVAFESWATNLVAGDTNAASDIFVHDRQTGTTTRVSVDSAGAQANDASTEATISGDGRFVGFTSAASNLLPSGVDTNGTADIFVHDRQTGTTSRVSIDSAGAQANSFSSSAAINATGRFVAFGSWASNLVPGDTNFIGDVFVRDRVGRSIAFTSTRDGNAEIYVMTPEGTAQTNLTQNAAFDTAPAWSPDGKKIAFISNRDGDMEIYVMNADGTNVTRLTYSPGVDTEPAWSPDGTQIAFASNRGGDFEIYVMDANGANQVNVTNRPSQDFEPDWSPDGTRIAFASEGTGVGDADIFVMNANGSGQVNLTNNGLGIVDLAPRWRPDGMALAFATNRDGNFEIYIAGFTATPFPQLTNPINVTNNPADDGAESAWSPDGKYIAFSSFRDGNFEVYVTDVGGLSPVRLTNDAGYDVYPSWRRVP